MGQPTHGITQRAGKCQMWQHMSFFSLGETSYGENMFKIQLGSKLAALFFLSLVLLPKHNFWLSSLKHRKLFFNARGWYAHLKYTPRLFNESPVFFRYYQKQSPRPLFRDGETTIFSLAYTHRKLRSNDLLWCQPRCFRVQGSILILLRALNVAEKKLRLRRTRSNKLNFILKNFFRSGRQGTTYQQTALGWF